MEEVNVYIRNGIVFEAFVGICMGDFARGMGGGYEIPLLEGSRWMDTFVFYVFLRKENSIT